MAATIIKTQSELLDIIKEKGVSALADYYRKPEYKATFQSANFMLNAMSIDKEALFYGDSSIKSDTDFAKRAIAKGVYSFKHSNYEVKSNKELATEMMKQDGLELRYLSDGLKADRSVVYQAVKQNGLAIEYAQETFGKDTELAIYAVEQNYKALSVINKKVAAKQEVITAAIAKFEKQPDLKNYINSKTAKHNRAIATYMIENGEDDLSKYSRGLKKDFSFVQKITERNPLNIIHAHRLMKDSTELAINLVDKDEKIYEMFSARVQLDENVAKKYVSIDGLRVKNLLSRARYNPNVAQEAVSQNGLALKYLRRMPKKYRETIVYIAVSNCGEALRHATAKEKDDENIVLAAVRSDESKKKVYNSVNDLQKNHPLKYANSRFYENPIVMMEAVRTEGLALVFGSKKIRKNRDIVLEAVANDGLALQFASKKLKKDPEIILAAIDQNPEALRYANAKYLTTDNSFAIVKALEKNGELFDILPKDLQKNAEIIMAAASTNPAVLKDIDFDFMRSKEYAQKLYMIDPKLMEHMAMEISEDKALMEKFEKLRQGQQKGNKQEKTKTKRIVKEKKKEQEKEKPEAEEKVEEKPEDNGVPKTQEEDKQP